jgi:hypothetical protein
MSDGTYRVGLLLILAGGFVGVNSDRFGDFSNLFAELSLFGLFFGLVLGVFGVMASAVDEGSE